MSPTPPPAPADQPLPPPAPEGDGAGRHRRTPFWLPAVSSRPPVFVDESGRRWRRVGRTAGGAAAALALVLAVAVALALRAPALAALGDTLVGTARRASVEPAAAPRPERPAERRAERRVRAATRHPGGSPAPFSVDAGTAERLRAVGVPGGRDPITAGFYVNWDENSRRALARHRDRLDWVVAEWVFLEPGGDSLRVAVDDSVFAVLAEGAPARRPRVLAMVTNVDVASRHFDAVRVGRLVHDPARRARAVARLAELVRRHELAGVTLDFEAYPASLDAGVATFVAELRAALRPLGAIVTATAGADLGPERAGELARAVDYLFLMLYDEHWSTSAAGPVASQGWYARSAAEYLRHVPAERAILALGAYGYHWTAGATRAVEGMTHQEVLAAAARAGVRPAWDGAALNPTLRWTDGDGVGHVVWYLDAVSGWNQARLAQAMGAAGVGVWRLGGEDPTLWQVLGRDGAAADPAPLAAMEPGYDVEFEGRGELLRLAQVPTAGRRTLGRDARTGLVTRVRIERAPTPFVVERVGADSGRPARGGGRKVALTFDDGPDPTWTPPILDTLRAYGVPATFFVVGSQVQAHMRLTRRIHAEGHEVGNHTFTHPNLSATPAWATRLELEATNRVIEAVLDRRTALFRPPYFGDAEPSTAEELEPVRIASELGMVTAGLHVDSRDWEQPRMTPDSIVRQTLAERDAHPLDGNVVLLHDGGGDRRATLAALGPMIDSLRARGDTLVLLSALTGVTREAAMPPLPPSGQFVRWVQLGGFAVAGTVAWAVRATLIAAVVLGVARVLVVLVLAAVQRRRGGRGEAGWRADPAGAAPPSVSVVVPAYNEERVIARTIASLLEQRYDGALEIVVVDDGSPDDTYGVAARAYGTHPQVAVHRKPNGGKASALNYGIARARGDVVVGMDADTVFLPDTVAELARPFADARVGAVAGNAKVGNPVNLVTRWQAVEYVTSQNLDRRAFALLDCITVVPGAVGAWRRDVVRAAGGFSDDTLAEDQDLTLAVRRRGWRVAYADAALAYTEAPDTLRALAKQRFRWSFGTLQCMWKHRDALFRREYGTLGWIAMPNTWLFQLVLAALGPLADLAFVLGLGSVWATQAQHGATHALTDLRQLLGYYLAFLLVDWGAGVVGFLMEPREDRRLTLLIFLQRFAYRQVMYWVVLRSLKAAVAGRVVGWGKLERKATVALPLDAPA